MKNLAKFVMSCFSSRRRGNKPVVGPASQSTFIVGQIYVKIVLSLSEYCRYYIESQLIFLIPILASLLYMTLTGIERFLAIKYTFREMTIVAGPGVNSWVIACFAKISRSLSDGRVMIFKVSAFFIVFLNFSLIYFVIYWFIMSIVDTSNQSNVNKFLHEPLQTLQRRRKL